MATKKTSHLYACTRSAIDKNRILEGLNWSDQLGVAMVTDVAMVIGKHNNSSL